MAFQKTTYLTANKLGSKSISCIRDKVHLLKKLYPVGKSCAGCRMWDVGKVGRRKTEGEVGSLK